MKTNFSQAKSWIISAIYEIKRVLNDLNLRDYSRVAFRSQFAVEKLNKAILSLIGLKIEKTHSPSEILKQVLKDEEILKIDKETEDLIAIILQKSEFFEKQGTKTRYGIIIDDKLKFPEEIYNTFKDIENFITNLVNMIKIYIILMEKIFKLSEKNFESLKILEELGGELNKWI